MTKILNWLKLNLASVLGIIQAVIKFIKEVLTAAVNILYPVIPSANFQTIVNKVRDIVNLVDGYVETAKAWLVKV